jgi:WD40 repeat protein
LASGSGDKTIRFWSTETYKTLFVLSGHSDNVKQISFSADGKYLASGSWDKSIKLWSVES